MQKKYVTVVSHIHLWRISSMYLFWCKYSHCVSIITESTVLRLLFTHKTHWKCTINLFINTVFCNINKYEATYHKRVTYLPTVQYKYVCRAWFHLHVLWWAYISEKKAKILLLYEIKYSINIRWKIQDKKCTWKWKKLPWQPTEIK